MDKREYTTLVEALREVPDPRHKRGIRHGWCLLMTLIGAAMLSGNQHGRAIAQWVREHTEMLIERLEPENGKLPSESTLRRALAAVAVDELEDRLSQLGRPKSKDKSALTGQSIDGKQVRGCGAHGRKVHLMSLALHTDAQVLAQLAIPDKSGEITAAPKLIEGRDLSGTLTTLDAQLAQRQFARHILRQKGHYLMVIKDNQPETREAIEALFTNPPWLPKERDKEYWRHSSSGKAHGRLESRVLEASTSLSEYLRRWMHWPGVGQVMRRTCTRVIISTGKVEEETTYGITSLSHGQADAAQLEAGLAVDTGP